MRRGGVLLSGEVDHQVGPARLWDRMSITSPDVHAGEFPLTAPGTRLALGLIDAAFTDAGAAKSGGPRAVPSAGALYPYEFMVITGDPDEPRGVHVLHVDPVRGLVHRLAGGPVARSCERAGLRLPDPGGAVVLVVSRPWLSMRKYGDRGYLYAQLDAAHLATNLLCVSSATGVPAQLRLRFDRESLHDVLGLAGRCRELHSAVVVGPGAGPAPDVRWSGRASARPSDLDVTWLELACWDSLGSADGVPEQARDVATGPFVAGGAGRRPPGWRELSLVRASAKEFVPAEVPADVLRCALSAIGTHHATDVRPDPDFHVSLVVRSVAGQPAAVIPLGRDGRVDLDVPPRPDDIAQACMHQDHLRDAAAFVLFHAPRRRVVGQNPRELIFRAGAVGQLLYLGAAEAGLGVTAVGGFDAHRWRRIARLPGDHEVLYLIALGAGRDTGTKWDRAHTAYAHDER